MLARITHEDRYDTAMRVSAGREHLDLDWFLLWTNPKCERKVVVGLVDAGFCAYSPHGRKWSKPRRASEYVARSIPAFTRYVFVGFPHQPDWLTVRRQDGVEAVVANQGAPLRLSSLVIDSVRAAEASGRFNSGKDPSEAAKIGHGLCYLPGATLRLKEGPLQGSVVTVKRRSDALSVEVEALLFGRATVSRVPLEMVEEAA